MYLPVQNNPKKNVCYQRGAWYLLTLGEERPIGHTHTVPIAERTVLQIPGSLARPIAHLHAP